MNVEPMLIGVVFTLIYIPTQIVILALTVSDVWKSRWSGKIRMDTWEAVQKDVDPYGYAEGDLRAFIDSLYDHTVPHIVWWKVFVYTIALGVGTSIVWWIITVSAMYVEGVAL